MFTAVLSACRRAESLNLGNIVRCHVKILIFSPSAAVKSAACKSVTVYANRFGGMDAHGDW